jgi:hypothetical protein
MYRWGRQLALYGRSLQIDDRRRWYPAEDTETVANVRGDPEACKMVIGGTCEGMGVSYSRKTPRVSCRGPWAFAPTSAAALGQFAVPRAEASEDRRARCR